MFFRKISFFSSRYKVEKIEKETVVCINYKQYADFDENYILQNNTKRNYEEPVREDSDMKWNQAVDLQKEIIPYQKTETSHMVPKNEESLEYSEESLEEDTTLIVPTVKHSEPPKSILKKTKFVEPFELNEDKTTLTFISDKDYDGPSEEFIEMTKNKVTKDASRTERRDTKAIIALQKARAKEEKERLKKAMRAEEEEEQHRQQEVTNNDISYQTRMSMLYSSQASSIFFADEEHGSETVEDISQTEERKAFALKQDRNGYEENTTLVKLTTEEEYTTTEKATRFDELSEAEEYEKRNENKQLEKEYENTDEKWSKNELQNEENPNDHNNHEHNLSIELKKSPIEEKQKLLTSSVEHNKNKTEDIIDKKESEFLSNQEFDDYEFVKPKNIRENQTPNKIDPEEDDYEPEYYEEVEEPPTEIKPAKKKKKKMSNVKSKKTKSVKNIEMHEDDDEGQTYI